MTASQPHELFDELAAGYALHALEPGDEQAFRSHLATCAQCERAVADHLETLGHLAYAADPVELPPSLLDGIRAEIQQDVPVAPAPVSLDAARERRRRRLPAGGSWVAAAAAVAIVMSLGVWNLALSRHNNDMQSRADQLTAAVKTLEQGGEHRVKLTDATGQLVGVALVRGTTVSMVVDGLAPNNASTSTYVLWQKGAYGVVRAIGTFDVRGTGVDVYRDMSLARDVVGVEGFAVTREPGRTAPATPGSKPVADGALSA